MKQATPYKQKQKTINKTRTNTLEYKRDCFEQGKSVFDCSLIATHQVNRQNLQLIHGQILGNGRGIY